MGVGGQVGPMIVPLKVRLVRSQLGGACIGVRQVINAMEAQIGAVEQPGAGVNDYFAQCDRQEQIRFRVVSVKTVSLAGEDQQHVFPETLGGTLPKMASGPLTYFKGRARGLDLDAPPKGKGVTLYLVHHFEGTGRNSVGCRSSFS